MAETATATKDAGTSTATTADKGATTTATTSTAATTTDKGTATTAATATTADTGTTTEAKPYWPEKWQERVSKGDDKRAKALKKFASPEDVVDSYLALERRFSSGEFKPALPKDAKAEELAAWRKDNGIPDAPDKYDLKDMKIPDGDKEIVASFLKTAHESNMTPAQAQASLKAYYAEQDRQVQQLSQRDEEQRQQTLDHLSEEWGGQRQRNINMIRGVLATFPESVRAQLEQARMPNGKLMFNDPDVARGWAALAMQLNPVGIVAPGGSGDIAKGAMAEYKELQTFMRENRSKYNADGAKQGRMAELIDYLSQNGKIDKNGNEIPESGAKKAA